MVSLLMFGSTPVFWSAGLTEEVIMEEVIPVGGTLGRDAITGGPLAGKNVDVPMDDGTAANDADRVVVLSVSASPERATRPLSLTMRESVTATILEILQEIDPHGYLAEGGAPNVYYEPASFLGWNVHDAEEITVDEVLARVEAAFGWERDTPPSDLAAAYVEAAERIVTDVLRPMRGDRGILLRECA